MLARVVRIASKYLVGRICSELLDRIHARWPMTLEEHDAVTDMPPDPALAGKTLALLRECGCSEADILSPLFYALSCVVQFHLVWPPFVNPAYAGCLDVLTPADFDAVLRGAWAIRQSHRDFLALPTPWSPCGPGGGVNEHPDHTACAAGVRAMWKAYAWPMLSSTCVLPEGADDGRAQVVWAAHAPVEECRYILGAYAMGLWEYGICKECYVLVVEQVQAQRRHIWESFPKYFGLA